MSSQRHEAKRTAETSIDLSVDVAHVWQALVTPAGLAPWMGEGSSIEPVVDGAIRLVDPVGGRTRSGRVDRVEEQSSLEFTWWPDDRPVERTQVSISLTPIETGTRLTVTESTTDPIGGAERGARAVLSGHGGGSVLRGAWMWRLAVLGVATQMVAV